jgi:hypothetical protein
MCSIGDIQFTSKTKCHEYVKSTIYEYNTGTYTDGSPEYEFLHNLLKNHEDYNRKNGSGISYFIIKKNIRGNGLQTSIMRLDGTVESFSWNNCAKRTFKSNKQKMYSAMRESVQYFIDEFKRQDLSSPCSNCTNKSYYEIDHINNFSVIRDDFINEYMMCNPLYDMSIEFDKGKDNQEKFKDEDYDFKSKWIEYHNTNCILQKLCKTCHNKKSKE